jgi:hypothetical protein
VGHHRLEVAVRHGAEPLAPGQVSRNGGDDHGEQTVECGLASLVAVSEVAVDRCGVRAQLATDRAEAHGHRISALREAERRGHEGLAIQCRAGDVRAVVMGMAG